MNDDLLDYKSVPAVSFNVGSNIVSNCSKDFAPIDATKAMEQWMKDGTVPIDYFYRQVGNSASSVRVMPKLPEESKATP